MGCRILIVEDWPDGREHLRQLLELLGYEVRVATNGHQGLELVLDWHPNAAIVDLGLPGLDGYQLAQRVRAILGDRVFLIALSAYSSRKQKRQAQEAGFNAHFYNLPDLDELYGVLEGQL
jgi:CheY-like chemotaxis protein